MDEIYVSLLNIVSQKVVAHFCVWFLSQAQHFWLRIWHWCCHTWEVHGNTPHQSHSKCTWSKPAGSNSHFVKKPLW
jgi:hypothetical protein